METLIETITFIQNDMHLEVETGHFFRNRNFDYCVQNGYTRTYTI